MSDNYSVEKSTNSLRTTDFSLVTREGFLGLLKSHRREYYDQGDITIESELLYTFDKLTERINALQKKIEEITSIKS